MKNIHLALELLTLIGSLEKPVYGFFVTSVTTVALDKSFEEIEPNLQSDHSIITLNLTFSNFSHKPGL